VETIPYEVVEATWQEVAGSSVEEMIEAQKRFIAQQPNIVEFVAALSEDLGEKVAELGIYLVHLIWRVFERAGRDPAKTVSLDQVLQAFDTRQTWLVQLVRIAKDIPEAEIEATDLKLKLTKPYLVRRVFEVFTGETDPELSKQDRAYLCFIMLAVIDALDQ